MKKIIFCIALMLVLGVSFSFAQETPDGQIAQPQRDILLSNFNNSIDIALANRSLLGLSDKQIQQIKKLSADVKKKIISIDAQIRTLKVDINTLSWEAPLNLDQSNALLAESHELFQQRGQYLLNSISDFHKILNKNQLKQFNSIS